MAVVQISRIQVRRGKVQTTPLPQLASGELGWAVDTQQLYIGNGSVAEGAPAVGNTKILTENDITSGGNLLGLLQHIYKVNDASITTGIDSNNPTTRSLQDQLDDRVTSADFGAIGNGIVDDTAALQRAINQLFLNPTTKSSAATASGTSTRVTLTLLPGIYKTSKTLYVPSYATIVGAGKDNTVIQYTPVQVISGTTNIVSATSATVISTAVTADMVGASISGTGINPSTTIITVNPGVSFTIYPAATATGTVNLTINRIGAAVQFVNDSSTVGNPSSIGSTLGTTQPRHIVFSGMTVESTTGLHACLQLDSVSRSQFSNLSLKGNWGHASDAPSLITARRCRGITFQSNSSIVTCDHNTFTNISFEAFLYAVYSSTEPVNSPLSPSSDIRYNSFVDCYFYDCYQGLLLSNGVSGSEYGARETKIDTCKFNNVKKHAIYVYKGFANSVTDCILINVGCDGGTNSSARWPQIYFAPYDDATGTGVNSIVNLFSDRHGDLASINSSTPYYPEATGRVSYSSTGVNHRSSLSSLSSWSTITDGFLFRLPVSTTDIGTPSGGIKYDIDYTYQSTSGFTRSGTITISAYIGTGSNSKIQVSDEYTWAGSDASNVNAQLLEFSAFFLTQVGTLYTNSGSPYSILVKYINGYSDSGTLTYSYTASVAI
jgi:hypothetical protein